MKKKMLIGMLTFMMLSGVAGCGATDSSATGSSDTSVTASADDSDASFIRGHVDDTFHTKFFDMTVNSVAKTDTFGNKTARSGYDLVVVGITVKNTGYETLSMYDSYFQLQWGDGDSDFANPAEQVSSADELYQFPAETKLGISASYGGYLVYEVPERYDDFWVVYQETFSDDTTGDTFACYFTPVRTDDSSDTSTDASSEASSDSDATADLATIIQSVTDSAAAASTSEESN